MSSAQARLSAVSGQLSASKPQGLLGGQVAIVTGVRSPRTRAPPCRYTLADNESVSSHRRLRVSARRAPSFSQRRAQRSSLLTSTRVRAPPPPPTLPSLPLPTSRLTASPTPAPGAGKADAVANEIKQAGGQAIAVGGDVTADDFPKKLVSKTIESVLQAHNEEILNLLADRDFDPTAPSATSTSYVDALSASLTASHRVISTQACGKETHRCTCTARQHGRFHRRSREFSSSLAFPFRFLASPGNSRG